MYSGIIFNRTLYYVVRDMLSGWLWCIVLISRVMADRAPQGIAVFIISYLWGTGVSGSYSGFNSSPILSP